MIAPDFPSNESARQRAVERYDILDTAPELDYDSITALIAHICDVPVSLITMLDHDRNFLKSHYGIDQSESPREISFCGHAINSTDNVMVVENTLEDDRFANNPLVTELGVRFYAGSPLVTPDGYRLGTLCVFDMKPRNLEKERITALTSLARQVETVLELRHQNTLLANSQHQLATKNQELREFAAMVTHDIKSPIISISYLTDSLLEDHIQPTSNDAIDCVQRIQGGVQSTLSYINSLLEYYTSDSLFENQSEHISTDELRTTLIDLVAINNDIELTIDSTTSEIIVNRSAITQVFLNLLTNSIKYNNSDLVKIHVAVQETGDGYEFRVTDNGIGIPHDIVDTVFDLFAKSDSRTIERNEGTGIGLGTVRKLINKMGGEVHIESTSEKGTTVLFNIIHI